MALDVDKLESQIEAANSSIKRVLRVSTELMEGFLSGGRLETATTRSLVHRQLAAFGALVDSVWDAIDGLTHALIEESTDARRLASLVEKLKEDSRPNLIGFRAPPVVRAETIVPQRDGSFRLLDAGGNLVATLPVEHDVVINGHRIVNGERVSPT